MSIGKLWASFCGKSDKRLGIVVLCDIIFAYHIASFAFMNESIRVGRTFDTDRLHHSTARLSAISRMYIDVFTPKALRTMIGVAVARDFCAAVFAFEIFVPSLKPLTEWHVTGL